MAIEKVNEMPELIKGVRIQFRELVEAVKDSSDGEIFKFTREDGKKMNTTTIRKMLEEHTKKKVLVQKYSVDTCHIKVLSKIEADKEEVARKKRAEEMKKKLQGKKKGQ